MYQTMEEIKSANRRYARENRRAYWFGKDETRFFSSSYGDKVIRGRFFVTGETPGDDHPRQYTVRIAHDDGSIATVGEFMAYAHRDSAYHAAHNAADEMLRTGKCPCGHDDD